MSSPTRSLLCSAASVALSLGMALPARAQSVPSPSPAGSVRAAPAPAPSGTVAATGPAISPSTAPIAQPGANASPEKVQKAEDVAKETELTPIIPSPTDVTRPAFQLYAEIDIPVLAVGIVFAAARLVRTQKAYCAPLCDPNDLNALDRTTAGKWSPAWSTASDVALYSIAGAAAVALVADEGFVDALNDSVVVAESALSATAVSSMLTLAAGRPRPFLYGENAPLADRNSSDAGLSFLSSHASVSFAIATSSYMATKRLHPKSRYPLLVLGVGGALATFVATARVEAGKHFITDSMGGALVGSALGVLIPAMHNSPVRVVPVVSQREQGMGFQGVF